MENTKAKKSFQAPHTFVILVALILIAVAATYVVPKNTGRSRKLPLC